MNIINFPIQNTCFSPLHKIHSNEESKETESKTNEVFINNTLDCSEKTNPEDIACSLTQRSNLTHFTFKKNRISKEIIEELLNQKKLEYLDFSRSRFDVDAFATFINRIEEFNNLQYLDLSNIPPPSPVNTLIDLVLRIKKLSQLKTLKLRNDDLTLLNRGGFTQLQRLDIPKCDLAANFGDFLEGLINLTHLDIHKIKGQIPQVIDGMGRLKYLRCLDSNVKSPISKVAMAIGTLTELRYLHISIYGSFETEVALALGNLLKLESLLISGCGAQMEKSLLDPAVISAMGKLTELRYLRISHCFFQNSTETMYIDFSALANLVKLRKISISKCNAENFAPYLGKFVNLENLDVSNNANDIASSDSLISSLSPEIEKLTKLQTLDLSYNGLTSDTATKLVPSLQTLPHLWSLDLSYNLIGLGSPPTWSPLGWFRSNPTERGLAISLQENLVSLKLVDLSNNHWGATWEEFRRSPW